MLLVNPYHHRLVAHCARLKDDRLDTPIAVLRREGAVYDSATRRLAHLFEHQIHHRGQAHAMLSSTRVAPPQLDAFFCSGDAALRADDFAEMGLSEALVWSP